MSKKIVIPKESFSDLNRYTGEYEIRYRIVSEDKNRFSYWSPIYSVDPEVKFVSGQIAVVKSNPLVQLIWDSVSIYKIINASEENFLAELPSYDIWVRWGRSFVGDWIYKERISSTSLSLIVPATYTNNGSVVIGESPNKISVEIYRPGRPVLRDIRSKEVTLDQATSFDLATDVVTCVLNTQCEAGDLVIYTSATPIPPLENDHEYFVRPVSLNQFTLHPTRLDAINNTNKINFNTTGTGTGTFYKDDFLLYRVSNETV